MRIFFRLLSVSLRFALPVASSALIGIGLLSCGSEESDGGVGTGGSGGNSAGAAGSGGGAGAGRGGSDGTAGSPGGSVGGSSGVGMGGDSSGGSGNGDAGASEPGAGDAGGVGGAGDAGAGDAGGSGGAAGDGAGGASGGGVGGGGVGGGGGGGAGGAGGAGDGGDSIESCFAGLRPLQGNSQISTRENIGEQIRLRIALETADRISTSGTFPWAAVRVGLEIDGALICLDEAALAGAHELSLHNCADVLSFEAGGLRYEITEPDEPSNEAGTNLSVLSGASVVRGPILLTTTACVPGGSPIPQCRSGGPC